MRKRRINAIVSSPKSSGDLDGGGGLCEDGVGAFLDDARQKPLLPDRDTAQNGLLPKIDASRRSPAGVAVHTRRGAELAPFRDERLAPGLEPEGYTTCVGRSGESLTFGER